MDKEFTCFFTGHRKIPINKKEIIEDILKIRIKNLIEDKCVENFIAGGALGFDTLAAETVIRLKEEYPYIKLNLYLPCYDQSKTWNYTDRYKWRLLMSKVDSYKYITEGTYTVDCMKKRNYRMVDDSFYGIAYCIMDRSGTGVTMRYAEQRGINVDNIADAIYE